MSEVNRALLRARDERIRELEAELATTRRDLEVARDLNRRTEETVRAAVIDELLYDVNEGVSGAETALTFLTDMRARMEKLR